MTQTEDIGQLAGSGGTSAVLIDVSQGFVMPTAAQRPKKAGELSVWFTVDTQGARLFWNSTVPTTTTGLVLNVGTLYKFTGEDLISKIRLISTTAGALLSYQFSYGARA